MNRTKIEIVNNLADTFRQYFQLHIPINIKELIKTVRILDGEIKVVEDINLGASMNLNDDSSFIIKIPKMEKNEIKYIIVYMLGHLVLYSNKFGANRGKNFFCKNNYSYEEDFFAQEFAVSLLMPKNKYYQILNKNTNQYEVVDIQSMANYFEVSKSAIIQRGKDLGVII